MARPSQPDTSNHHGVPPSRPSAATELRHGLRITALDRLLINAVVDARQAVTGALNEADLNDAVDEFINLNGRRHQSYYHAGLRDALFEQRTELPAESRDRMRWYWTGAIFGWARSESWQAIVDAYDEHAAVRELGDGLDRASGSVGLEIAKALWNTGRGAELTAFVTVALAMRNRAVYLLLLEVGTTLLRRREAGAARAVFDLLMRCEQAGKPQALAEQASRVRRRMAHCLRLLGEHQRAEELLLDLLHDGDADMLPMIHADLGMLKGGFALLDEVRIPDDDVARHDLVDRLKAGEPHYRQAIEMPDAPFVAHGHYCLGVLALTDDALGKERYAPADAHLERAHAHFAANRASYPPSLVAQAELYLGIAKAQLWTPLHVNRAGHFIAAGLDAEAHMPTCFIAETIEALDCSEAGVEEVAAPLLQAGGDEALDALAATAYGAGDPPVAEKLLQRAERNGYPESSAAADLRAASRMSVGDDVQAEILDRLEGLAANGVADQEFLELLEDPKAYDPAWSRDDAAVASARCLEAQGRFSDALQKLREVFHRYMQKGRAHDALSILKCIRAYGLSEDEYVDLERRHAHAAADAESSAGVRATHVHVLVVGGDETQAKGAGKVESKVGERDSRISMHFIRTGWTSNWKEHLDDVERRLPDVDGVVILRFIRTTLGKRVREACRKRDTPWRLCWSGGQGGVAEAIVEVADAARRGPVRDS